MFLALEWPHWLTKDSSEWSKMCVPNRPSKMSDIKISKRKEDTNASATLVSYSLQKGGAPKQRFSSWTHLVRVHAQVRRVLHNLCSRDDRKAGMEMWCKEIKDGEEEIVSEAFEYAALSLGKPIPQKSLLIKLNPCIDKDSVIRCDRRLKFAEFLPCDNRCPIILPYRH